MSWFELLMLILKPRAVSHKRLLNSCPRHEHVLWSQIVKPRELFELILSLCLCRTTAPLHHATVVLRWQLSNFAVKFRHEALLVGAVTSQLLSVMIVQPHHKPRSRLLIWRSINFYYTRECSKIRHGSCIGRVLHKVRHLPAHKGPTLPSEVGQMELLIHWLCGAHPESWVVSTAWG